MKRLLLPVLFALLYTGHASDSPVTDNKCALGAAHSHTKIQFTRPQLQLSSVSPSGKFLIHYDTSGPNAVDNVDADGNSIPDYVDSTAYYFDRSYEILVDELGYPAPAGDDSSGGGTDLYDVYLVDNIGEQYYYGTTNPEKGLGTGGGRFERYSTFIIIDNNFSPLDVRNGSQVFYEKGYAALKVTAVHELYHAVQFSAYGNAHELLFYELTSTWMEIHAFPDVHDYEQHLIRSPRGLFFKLEDYPLGGGMPGGSNKGYRYGIFGEYLDKTYGPDIFRTFWENVGRGEEPYKAFDLALRSRQSDLGAAWCGFMPWIYHTNTRSEPEYLHDAERFPLVKPFDTAVYSYPSIMMSGSLNALEMRFLRFVLPGNDGGISTLDLGLANPDVNNAPFLGKKRSYSLVIQESPAAGASPIPGTKYFLSLSSDEPICTQSFVQSVTSATLAYPNPFRPEKDPKLFLPVPRGASPAKSISVVLLAADLIPVYSGELYLTNTGEGYTLSIDDVPENISSGVYIYKVGYGDEVLMGKVAVQR